MPTREMLFLVAGADVDLHVLVADAANDVTAKLVAAVMSAGGMSVEEFVARPESTKSFHDLRRLRRFSQIVGRFCETPHSTTNGV